MVRAAFLVLGVWVGSLLWWLGLSLGIGLFRRSIKPRHLALDQPGSGGILFAVRGGFAGHGRATAYRLVSKEKVVPVVYLPPPFTETRPEVLIAHIERHDFALLVSHGPAGLVASHIPFLVERRGDELHLLGHLARPNPQVADSPIYEPAAARC